MLETALSFSHTLLKEIVLPGNQVIDATMGNGHDTLFLAKLVGSTGHVYAFDLQKQALENTSKKLAEHNLTQQVTLFQKGHEQISSLLPTITPITAAIFNLGYLPKSDKQIITQPETTLTALSSILKLLVPKGRVILVIYYGHKGGELELTALTNYCQNLPQKEYSVATYQFINQKNNPPILFCIEKK